MIFILYCIVLYCMIFILYYIVLYCMIFILYCILGSGAQPAWRGQRGCPGGGRLQRGGGTVRGPNQLHAGPWCWSWRRARASHRAGLLEPCPRGLAQRPLQGIVLYCTVIYCIQAIVLLYCTVLYCIVFKLLYCCTILYCIVLYSSYCIVVLYCTVIYCIQAIVLLYCTVIYCIQAIVLLYCVLYCTVLYCIPGLQDPDVDRGDGREEVPRDHHAERGHGRPRL